MTIVGDQAIIRKANAARKHGKLTPEQIREGLLQAGLRESERWIDGYGFTFRAKPEAAIRSYVEHHRIAPAAFHISGSIYLLAEANGQEEKENE